MMRIVSLLPSATEIVCALGGESDLVGRSHECDFPAAVVRLPVCTEPKVRTADSSAEIHASITAVLEHDVSVYRLYTDVLRELCPDVIVTQVQCDVCAVSLTDVEAAIAKWLGSAPHLIALNPSTFESIFSDICRVGEAIGRDARALIAAMRSRIAAVAARSKARFGPRPRVATVEWIAPLMTAGNWVPEMIELAGGQSVFGIAGRHSPLVHLEDFARADPDVIAVFPCGFSVERTRADMALLEAQPLWRGLRAVRNGNVFLFDGNQYFNRPGPRIVDSLEMLEEALAG